MLLNPLSTIFSLLFLGIACFYLFRLVSIFPWIHQLDAENEIGHGLMAVGMALMFAPFDLLTADLLRWNILVFALASMWFVGRLFTHRPLLAVLLRAKGTHSTGRSDAIHALMHAGMSFMFLLMGSMQLSMTLPATYLSCGFFVSFVFLTSFYVREVSKDLQSQTKNGLQLGANLAHVLMSGAMSWMFLQMLTMTMSMAGP